MITRFFDPSFTAPVQVAILIALAIALGVIFKSEITQFVNDVFSKLKA